MKKRYVVRVVIVKEEILAVGNVPVGGIFLECLRYAGLVRVHEDNEARQVFDLVAPSSLDTKTWAEQNAARMQTFGYNAVVAPSV